MNSAERGDEEGRDDGLNPARRRDEFSRGRGSVWLERPARFRQHDGEFGRGKRRGGMGQTHDSGRVTRVDSAERGGEEGWGDDVDSGRATRAKFGRVRRRRGMGCWR